MEGERHSLATEKDDGIEYKIMGCHNKGQAMRVARGASFSYCPFCGDEVDFQ